MDANQQARFSPDEPQRRTSRSWLPTCLIGCLVGSVVLLFICAGVAWYVITYIRPLGADFARRTLVDFVESSELPDEDKQAVITQVDRVADAFKRGDIGVQEVGRIFEELSESPLFGMMLVYAAEAKYIQPSGLSEEEKQEGRIVLQRVARGVYEKRIERQQLDRALDYISTETSDGQRQLKDEVSDAVLRDFLAECRRLADEAEVPDEPYQLDIGDEFEKVIDRALQQEAMQQEADGS